MARSVRDSHEERGGIVCYANRRLLACAGAVALVFACSIVVGSSFAETLSFDKAFGSLPQTGLSFLGIAILSSVFTALLAIAYHAIDKQARALCAHHSCSTAFRQQEGHLLERCSTHAGQDTLSVHLRKRFFIYAGLLALVWAPTIVVHAPGTITYDNFVQMLVDDGLTPYYSAHNPPFDTWMYGLFWDLGDALGNRPLGLALHTILQVALVISGIAASFCWLRLVRVPRSVRIALFALACTLPLFPLSAECMTKDYSFAAVFLPWSLAVCEYVRTNGRLFESRRAVALFFALTMLLMMTKKTGVYIAVPVAILSAVVMRKASLRLLLSTLAAALLYLVAFEMLFFSFAGIVNGSSREMLSIPMQQTARCALEHPGDVTEAENAAITTVFGNDWQAVLPEAYNPTISDPVKALYYPYASTSDTLSYLAAWASQGVRHPATYLESFFANTYECAYPFVLMDQEMDIPAEWSTPEFAASLLSYTRDDVNADAVFDSIGGVHSASALEEARIAYNNGYEAIASLPIVNVLTSKALYALWIPLFAVGCLVYRRQPAGLLMVSPALLCLCALLAGPVSQSRYITPELYACFLVIGACWVTSNHASVSRKTRAGGPQTPQNQPCTS
ncbi:MAG TPA: hypothetical protein IAA95_06840 [Candidatus Aveggerthella excrementigallinarum]|nr:hypothetical protein [Candidatus Aveggerthella excrementigallinarum]